MQEQKTNNFSAVDANLVDNFDEAVSKYRDTLEEYDFDKDKEYNKEA